MINRHKTQPHSNKDSILKKPAQDDSEHIFHQACSAHRQGRLAKAEKGYLEILAKKPDWGQVLYALGTLFLDQSRPDKAKTTFEKSRRPQPSPFTSYVITWAG